MNEIDRLDRAPALVVHRAEFGLKLAMALAAGFGAVAFFLVEQHDFQHPGAMSGNDVAARIGIRLLSMGIATHGGAAFWLLRTYADRRLLEAHLPRGRAPTRKTLDEAWENICRSLLLVAHGFHALLLATGLYLVGILIMTGVQL